MHMHMTSKNVAIRKDVYDALRKERRPDESFTKLLLRLINQRGPLQDLEGAWGSRGGEGAAGRWRGLRFGKGGSP